MNSRLNQNTVALLYLFAYFMFLLNSCSGDVSKKFDQNDEIKKVTTEDKVLNFINQISKTNLPKKIDIRIDSTWISGDVQLIDSLNKTIYLGIQPQNKNNLYRKIKQYFEQEYGKTNCKDKFCSWKKIIDKKTYQEVLLMDESMDKKIPFIGLEIEYFHDQ